MNSHMKQKCLHACKYSYFFKNIHAHSQAGIDSPPPPPPPPPPSKINPPLLCSGPQILTFFVRLLSDLLMYFFPLLTPHKSCSDDTLMLRTGVLDGLKSQAPPHSNPNTVQLKCAVPSKREPAKPLGLKLVHMKVSL